MTGEKFVAGKWYTPTNCGIEGAVRVLGDPDNGVVICRTPRGGSLYHTILIRWRGTCIQRAEVSLHDMQSIERRAVALARDIATRVGWYLGEAEEDSVLDHEEGLQ
ncbi:MAG: hypothetical protein MOGMAGMI_02463 [Candidatus Omnitrophica bacterium]|nr:hypothetical protein [Candidatus Omnitrophota bacterium]